MLENLASAYDKYYKKQGGKPRFKSKKRNDVTSYTTKCVNHNIEVMGNAIKLPKLKKVKAKMDNLEVDTLVVAFLSLLSTYFLLSFALLYKSYRQIGNSQRSLLSYRDDRVA